MCQRGAQRIPAARQGRARQKVASLRGLARRGCSGEPGRAVHDPRAWSPAPTSATDRERISCGQIAAYHGRLERMRTSILQGTNRSELRCGRGGNLAAIGFGPRPSYTPLRHRPPCRGGRERRCQVGLPTAPPSRRRCPSRARHIRPRRIVPSRRPRAEDEVTSRAKAPPERLRRGAPRGGCCHPESGTLEGCYQRTPDLSL